MSIAVSATRAISKGEEITITYTDLKVPREERQKILLNAYDFTCTCTHCSFPNSELIAQSDGARVAMVKFRDSSSLIPEWLSDTLKPDDLVINICLERITLIEREGLEGEEIYLAHHRLIAQAYEALGEEANFREWALKTARVEKAHGNHKESLRWKKKAAGKTDGTMWGVRKNKGRRL